MEELTVQTSDNFKLSARKIKTTEIEAFEMTITIYKDSTPICITKNQARQLGEWLIKNSEE